MLSIVEEFDVIYIVYLFLVMVILIVIGYMCFLIINCVDIIFIIIWLKSILEIVKSLKIYLCSYCG